jgi:hypothetical protein
MRSRWWPAATVGLVAALLAGCAGIPTSGPVHEAGQLNGVGDEPFTRIVALGPAEGADQTSIVGGFLGAAASFDDNHAIARSYLTPEAARSWNPTRQVLVYQQVGSEPGTPLAAAGKNTLRFTAPKVGQLDEQGAYTGATPGQTVTGDFTLAQVGGQWRIAKLPSALLLTSNDLLRAYRSYDIYFPDPARSVLVPDEVLVPVGPGVSTSLVRALLQGPSGWLGKVVRTAIPSGSRLVVDSVPVSDGVAQVDLTGPAASVARGDVQAMSAQIVWTLGQVGGINGVRITVEGVPLQVPGQGDVQDLRAWRSFDPDGGLGDARAYAVTDKGRAVVLGGPQGRDVLPVRGPLGDGTATASLVVPSYDGTMLAGLDQDRNRLLLAGLTAGAKGEVVSGLPGTRLTAPSWDRQGDVFVATTGTSSAAYMVPEGSTQARPVALDTGSLPKGGTLSALRISRDGARVAVLVDSKGTGQVYLGLLQRANGAVSLGGFRVVTSAVDTTVGQGNVVDVAWETADRLLVLERSDTQTVALRVDLNGTVEQGYGSLPAGTLVAATALPGQDHPILGSSADGLLYLYVSGTGSWTRLDPGTYPAYPG